MKNAFVFCKSARPRLARRPAQLQTSDTANTSHRKSPLRLNVSPCKVFAALGIALSNLVALSAPAQNTPPTATNSAPYASQNPAEDPIVLPTGFKDPIEGFNRAMWGFNKGFMTWGVRPFSWGYRRVVVKPLREGIGRIGKNITYPDRLANNLLQGHWAGAGQETLRCICNTVLGFGGFFDVATRWGIPKYDADFGQTFQKWGWKPGFFLMLPIFGTERRPGRRRFGRRHPFQPDVLLLSLRIHQSGDHGQ